MKTVIVTLGLAALAGASNAAGFGPVAAANCAALTSGTYRLVAPLAGAGLAAQTDTLTVDAGSLVVTRGSGAVETWAPNGACAYLADAGRTEVVVSSGKLMVLRFSDDGGTTWRWGVAIPERRARLSTLAGNWNFVGLRANAAGTGFTAIAASATLDGAGTVSNLVRCQNDTTWGVTGADCAPVTSGVPALKATRGGAGLSLVDPASGAVLGSAYVYRPRGGVPVMIWTSGDGGVQFATPQAATPLPVVGTATVSWNHYASAQLASLQPIGTGSTAATIESVDATAGTWVRLQKNVGQNNEHPEAIAGNVPRSGYNFRPRQTSTTTTGASITVNEWTSLPLQGLGGGAFFLPSLKQFALSVVQP